MRSSLLPICLLSLGVAACTAPEAKRSSLSRPSVQAALKTAPPPAASSARVPDVDVASLELVRFPGGEKVSLSAFRGQVVVLDLWATWCAPCVESLPAYLELERRLGERGLVFLALSLDEDPRQVERFLEAQQLTLPNVFLEGPEQPVATALGLRGLPTTYLFDRQGLLRHVHEGYLPDEFPGLVTVIEGLLDEKG